MANGDFELEVGYRRPTDIDEIEQLTDTLSSILCGKQDQHPAGAAATVTSGDSVKVHIYDRREECQEDPTTPHRTPIGITIHLTGANPKWGDNLELAQFLYAELDRRQDLDLLLLHDDEQLVAHNFEDSSTSGFGEFRYWQ